MPAIFHNSTAADSSTNTAARPASASRLWPPPRAPSAWPRPRGPRLHRVHLSADSLHVLCLSSPRTRPLSPAVCLSSPPQPQALSLSVPFLGPLPHLSTSLLNTPPLSVCLTPTPPPHTHFPWLAASPRLPNGPCGCLSVVRVIPCLHPSPPSRRWGWGRGDAVCSPSPSRLDSPSSGFPQRSPRPRPGLASLQPCSPGPPSATSLGTQGCPPSSLNPSLPPPPSSPPCSL